jgi:hypothetical protein
VLEPSAFEVEIAIEKVNRHKLLDIDQIPAEFFKAGGRTIHSEHRNLINSIWKREELSEQWKRSVIVSVYKKGFKVGFSK